MKPSLFFVVLLVGLTVFLTACPGGETPNPRNFQLKVTVDGDGSGEVTSDPGGISCGEDCENTFQEDTTVTLTAQAGEGSSFAGFEGCTVNANTANVCTVEMDAAKTVTATFAEEAAGDTFDLAVELAGLGIGTVTSEPTGIDCTSDIDGSCVKSFDEATSVTLTAAPSDANSIFTGFSSNCVVDDNDSDVCTVEVADSTAATTVTATFAPADADQFVLNVSKDGAGNGTVTSSPAGIDCGTDCTEPFAEATTVTLTAIPAEGSEFAGFTNCVTGANANECTVDVNNADASIDVTASFNEEGDPSKVTLTVEKKGNGADQGFVFVEAPQTGSQEYTGPVQFDPGTEVELNIVIGQGATNFLGWSGACGGTPSNESCELTLDADTNVVAQFSDGSEPTANGTIAGLSDDAEEYLGTNPNNSAVVNGNVDVESGDLDLTFDVGPAQVSILSGLRFTGINLPANATVLYSYIQFRSEAVSPADGSDTDDPNDDLPPVRMVISGEKSTSSGTFFEQFRNISGRPDTDASVDWSPPAWNQGTNPVEPKRTPDLTGIVQEIAAQPGWDGADGEDGTMTFFLAPPKDDNGNYIGNEQNYRRADALDDAGAGTPARLVIIYEVP